MKLLWQQIPSTIVSEIYCQSNFDGIVLDTEHSPYNNETLFCCIQIIKLSNKKCFVRLAHLDKIVTKMCLDSGVDGLIFSTIETVCQSKEIIDYCRYPHFSGKRGQGLNRENQWGKTKLGIENPILIAQIETKKAVDNLIQINSIGFDNFLIGPYDLSASLGCVGNFENDIYWQYINKITELIPKNKLGVHIPKDIENQVQNFQDYGIIAYGMDTTMLIDAINKIEKI